MAETYLVEGMTCEGCAKAVTSAIKKLAPSAVVTVDLQAKRVSVDGCGDPRIIALAVENAGFEFGGQV